MSAVAFDWLTGVKHWSSSNQFQDQLKITTWIGFPSFWWAYFVFHQSVQQITNLYVIHFTHKKAKSCLSFLFLLLCYCFIFFTKSINTKAVDIIRIYHPVHNWLNKTSRIKNKKSEPWKLNETNSIVRFREAHDFNNTAFV